MAGEVSQVKESRDVEYDMTGGWVFNLRLFSEEEQELWKDVLSNHEEHAPIGAQWNLKEVENQPPATFDKHVKFRPIFLKATDEKPPPRLCSEGKRSNNSPSP